MLYISNAFADFQSYIRHLRSWALVTRQQHSWCCQGRQRQAAGATARSIARSMTSGSASVWPLSTAAPSAVASPCSNCGSDHAPRVGGVCGSCHPADVQETGRTPRQRSHKMFMLWGRTRFYPPVLTNIKHHYSPRSAII